MISSWSVLRAFESAAPGSHAIVPRHDPRQMERETFAHLVARQFCRAAASDALERRVLAVRARVPNEIEAAPDEPTAQKVAG